jgi:glycosyltransferase involved in cell wall biosynthesis
VNAAAREGPLPVGVVIPCRNSAALVPRHLAALAPWIERAEEVIVVDSDSTDGTPELLRAGIRHPSVRFLRHPPGLYASWNFGIKHVRSTYTYVATMGDTITPTGLARLVETAERFGSDVVISPPRFVPLPGHPDVDWTWPVHRLIEWGQHAEPQALSGALAFLLTALKLPSGILGSSASNLYRTSTLQARPFPVDYGKGSDTAWALQHGLDVKWALLPTAVAEFLVHPSPADAHVRNLTKSLKQLAAEVCRGRGSRALPRGLYDWLTWEPRLARAKRMLRAARKAGGRWLLSVRAWRAYWTRGWLRRRVPSIRRSLQHRLRAEARRPPAPPPR